MSWASKRKTTRCEDVADRLLGIFEVNMPLLYGEGVRAFIRLQHEIVGQSSDQSMFAWRYEQDTGPHGIFASSPAAVFFSSGNIVVVDMKASPFFVTNRGLHITIPIYMYNGALLCRFKNDHYTIITTPLCEIDGHGTYARVDADFLGTVDYRAWNEWGSLRPV
jgi:hypothetical protein